MELNNNNKKISYKLAKQSLKESKMRNIFILVTIVLSVSLLSGIIFFSNAIVETEHKELSKRQHVIYEEVTENQIAEIKGDSRISESSEYKAGKSFEVDNYILMPYYKEDSDSKISTLDIVQGEFPKEIDEVLVDKQLMEYMNLKAELGQVLNIEFLDGTVEAFKVSGFLEGNEEISVFNLFLSKEYALNGSQLKEVPFNLAAQIHDAEKMGSDKFLDEIRELGADYGVERKNINENNSFVESLSYDNKEITMTALIGFIILSISIIVIYSIFYISISERTRQFGQLRTVGMTKKQIKKMVRVEGTVLSIVGSVIGISIGAIFAFSMKPEGFNFVNFLVYTIAILFANYITVRVAILKPARIAANISPIEALKVSGYEGNKKKTSKKLYRKLSPLSLSFIAFDGNRKKSAMTLLSLSVAGIAFMCAVTFITSIDEEKFSRQGWFEYGEYVLGLSSNAAQVNKFGYTGLKENNPLNDEIINQIKNIDGINQVMELKNLEVSYTYNNETSDDIAGPFSREEADLMKPYMNSGQLNYDEMVKNKEILIANNDIAKEIFGWKFNVGDKVKLKWYNGEKYVEDEFTIAGDLKNNISNNDKVSMLEYNTGWFLMPEETLEEMMIPGFNLNNRLVISCGDYKNKGANIDNELSTIADNSSLINISTLSDAMEHHKEQYNVIFTTTLGAAIFVIVFSLINLLNTLITNAMARKREFASLRTLGMSKKQVATMIRWDGLYFAIVNIITTVVIGSFSGFILVKIMAHNGLEYMKYEFPLSYLLGYIALVLIVPIVISNIIIKILGKKSLVERLRESE